MKDSSKSPVVMPGPKPDGWISSDDFEHMRSLGMNDPKEYERLKGLSTEELMEEYVEDIRPTDNYLSYIVVDDFYNDPDIVREYALTRDYVPRGEHGAVGHRTHTKKIFKGTKEKFETLIGDKTVKGTELGGWDYATNGVFQHCMAEDPFVIHADTQRWAAMVYLTPDPPPQCGTNLYRHKATGKFSVENDSDWNMFAGNFYDETPFEVVDRIGNRYNRMVLFDARNIHAAAQYFGDDIDNDRLFQIFFFNTKNAEGIRVHGMDMKEMEKNAYGN